MAGCVATQRQLETDDAASAVAGDDARAVRPEGPDLRCEVRRELLDTRKRFAVAIDTRRLEPEERLILAQMPHEGTVAEDVAIVSAQPDYFGASHDHGIQSLVEQLSFVSTPWGLGPDRDLQSQE
jgi:hypothetical protein